VIAVDTNVLARFLLNDTPTQSTAAADLLRAELCTAPVTVILELVWVLESRGWQRQNIAAALHMLSTLDKFAVQNADAFAAALSWYEQGMGFADSLHLALSSNASQFKSFDKDFIKASRRLKTIPLVSLP
jgi:predicted nucleic-acid-binding protein